MPGGNAPALTLKVIGVEPLAPNTMAVAELPASLAINGDTGPVMAGRWKTACVNARLLLP